MAPLLLTAAEVAELLAVSVPHFYVLRRKGLFGPDAVRLSTSVRFSRTEIEAWIAAGSPPRDQWQALKAQQRKAVDHVE